MQLLSLLNSRWFMSTVIVLLIVITYSGRFGGRVSFSNRLASSVELLLCEVPLLIRCLVSM